jgi:hypothetical protein
MTSNPKGGGEGMNLRDEREKLQAELAECRKAKEQADRERDELRESLAHERALYDSLVEIRNANLRELAELRERMQEWWVAHINYHYSKTPESLIALGKAEAALRAEGKGEKNMKHWRDCDCQGAVFVKHIIEHLLVGDEVICKICKKTVAEIAGEAVLRAAGEPEKEEIGK